MTTIRVASAQINTTVGDIAGNCKLVGDSIEHARALGVDIVVFPELSITGYPPEDLLLSEYFIRSNRKALDKLVERCRDIAAVIGIVDFDEDADGNIECIYNAAATIVDRRIVAVYHKHQLPNYGVFDELRYFNSGATCHVVDINGTPVGINICEDVWVTPGPGDVQGDAGARIILTLNSSPYEIGKLQKRIDLVTSLAKRNNAYAIYTNQVGGQDELVFDGSSIFAGPQGEVLAIAPRFREALVPIDIKIADDSTSVEPHGTPNNVTIVTAPLFSTRAKPSIPELSDRIEDDIGEVYEALILGTRDYVRKTGFQKIAVALSGGIDSAIVACIAVDAIGNENVVGVAMPSRYSSEASLVDAQQLADNLLIPLWRIPIEPAHRAFESMLSEQFEGTQPNTAEENVQSRIRGNVMMTIANKFGWLILTTGNKSEMATGYATLYGDMAGGFAIIKDIPKQMVYLLSQYRNQIDKDPPIPPNIISKAPSAELKPDQFDSDSLPDYDTLDPLLKAYVEERQSPEQILGQTDIDPETANRVIQMVDRNEYKRRQSPPGIKITGLAFGRDRRMPIASKWRHY